MTELLLWTIITPLRQKANICRLGQTTQQITKHPIKKAIEGIGVKWIRQIDLTWMLRILNQRLSAYHEDRTRSSCVF